MPPPIADLASFLDGVDKFFSGLAAVHWGPLLLALGCFAVNLTLRSRAVFHTLRAAYPAARFPWRRIWGAYVAGVGFNSLVPARGGDIVKLYLARNSIPSASYPTVAAGFAVEGIFDAAIGVLVLLFAFTQGVFPKPPDFSKLDAFDLSYLASHMRLTLFVVTALAVLVLVAFALLSAKVKAFWARVRQGFTILSDRGRYLREVAAFQLVAWLLRAAAYWLMLDAFAIGGSVRNVLLVFGVNAVAAAVPLAPGGAGVQQALLVKVFAAQAGAATVAAYSVGQQIALAAFAFGLGFAALLTIFRLRSFKEVVRLGREQRTAEQARRAADATVERGAGSASPAGPRAPRARA